MNLKSMAKVVWGWLWTGRVERAVRKDLEGAHAAPVCRVSGEWLWRQDMRVLGQAIQDWE